jgi:hypothetical protein
MLDAGRRQVDQINTEQMRQLGPFPAPSPPLFRSRGELIIVVELLLLSMQLLL